MHKEANIKINDKNISSASSMTLRVALNHFIQDMDKKYALGTDDLGEQMRKAYLSNANLIMQRMMK